LRWVSHEGGGSSGGGSLGDGSSGEGPSGPSVVQDPRDGSFLESFVMQDHRYRTDQGDAIIWEPIIGGSIKASIWELITDGYDAINVGMVTRQSAAHDGQFLEEIWSKDKNLRDASPNLTKIMALFNRE